MGFDYFIYEETLRDYQKKSLELRLKWLYYGNKFRQQYPREVIEKQEKLRGAQIETDPDRFQCREFVFLSQTAFLQGWSVSVMVERIEKATST